MNNNLDKNKAIAHLNNKWGSKPCPMCGNAQWSISDKIFELREFYGGDILLGGSIFPVFTVMCTNCGNTVFVNGIVSKVVEPQNAKENEQ